MINNENKITVKEDSANARLRAKIITSAAKEQYDTEIERLRIFIERWNDYTQEIVKEYPNDRTRKTVAVAQVLKDILNREETPEFTSKEKIAELYLVLDEVKPKQKSFYGEGDNGFNMDDVLNPKEKLDLDTLLKELGVK